MKLLHFSSLVALVAGFRNLEEVNFNCVGYENGNYGHPESCDQFYTCTNGVAKVQSCPLSKIEDGTEVKLVYDHDLRTCTWKSKITCDDAYLTEDWESCRGKKEGINYPGFNVDQYFTCKDGVSQGLSSCTYPNEFDVFKRECVAFPDYTWSNLITSPQKIDAFLAHYANKNGENITYYGADDFKHFEAHSAEKLGEIAGEDKSAAASPCLTADEMHCAMDYTDICDWNTDTLTCSDKAPPSPCLTADEMHCAMDYTDICHWDTDTLTCSDKV